MAAAPSLYRRHRPRSFDEVVGQAHVVRTLRHAIERDRVHHAYLFVGSRGTGKTSMAKILAASLNCERGGPTVFPCGVCDSCTSIASATSLDVIEMDAASNNSVDDIRDLRERVAYAPVSGRHKVYILDEAHMLSTQAWNAFLKTLEEPPPNTIFVLATTEANKVLPTVVDRCHRFDFARPDQSQIASVLRRVADSESIEIGDEAVALIARSATGSFRDALGTLEQLLAYSGADGADGSDGASVALEDVLAVLGAADSELLLDAVDAVANADARQALHAVARLSASGRDVGRFLGDLEAHARGLMIVGVMGEVPRELRVTEEQDARLSEQAGRVGQAEVVRLLDLLAAGVKAIKDGSEARTQLELALVKAASPALDPGARALAARVERLERGAPVAAPRQTAIAAPPAAPVIASPAPTPVPAALADLERADGPGRTSVAVVAQVGDQPAVATSTTVPGTPPPPADGDRAAAVTALVGQVATETAEALATEEDPTPAVAAIAVVDPLAPTPEHATIEHAIDLDLGTFGEVWPAVIESVGGENRLLAASLAEAHPVGLADSELTLAWGQSAAFSKRMAEAPINRELIAQAIRGVTGSALRLAYALRTDAEHAAAPASGGAAGALATPELTEEQLIERLVSELDAEEIHAEDPPPPPPPTET